MKKASKLHKLLNFDLHTLKYGSRPIETSMIQLSFLDRAFVRVIGVDEVGRGCLAGPVMASAVSFDLENLDGQELLCLDAIDDSKVLGTKTRERLSSCIRSASVFAFGHVSNEEVDKYNILNASLMSMRKAVLRLLNKLEDSGIDRQHILVLVDGKMPIPDLPISQLPVSKGDSQSISIASASIIAKVTRDKLMTRYNCIYPDYLWSQNKGYPSKSHVLALKQIGPSPLHRASFNWQEIRT